MSPTWQLDSTCSGFWTHCLDVGRAWTQLKAEPKLVRHPHGTALSAQEGHSQVSNGHLCDPGHCFLGIQNKAGLRNVRTATQARGCIAKATARLPARRFRSDPTQQVLSAVSTIVSAESCVTASCVRPRAKAAHGWFLCLLAPRG